MITPNGNHAMVQCPERAKGVKIMTNETAIVLAAAVGSVEIAGTAIDLTALPGKSISALLSRGLTHYFGSEQASRVKAWKDKVLEETKVEPAEDEVVAFQKERFGIALSNLLEGTIGQRAIGITIDPLEKVKAQIARQDVVDILRANSIKVPKGDEAVEFADGTKKAMADMVKTRLEKDGDAIEKRAKAVIKEREKAKAKAEESAKAVESKTADSLGL